VPVIDLDSPARPTPTPARRNPRVLIMAVVGLLLLGLPGEAAGPTLPFRSSSVCTEPTGYMSTLGYESSLVIVDVDSGGVVHTTTVYGGC
jgi:hypothetical protein